MSAANSNSTPFELTTAARRTKVPTLLIRLDTKPAVSGSLPPDPATELEPHWAAVADAATD